MVIQLNPLPPFLSSSEQEFDRFMLKKCLDLARLGESSTSPNPMVGAILVKKRRVISVGYHRKSGEPHAERIAIDLAKEDVKGSALYINLEPCVHFGKTPPCADYIIQNKIKKVVIGTEDPNPIVKGKGVKKLEESKISVKIGVLKDECKELNRKYFTFHEKKRPFVALKLAMSIDGNIATLKGESKWITGKYARIYSHKLRGEFDAIAIGAETLRKDNPSLTPRLFYAHKKPVPFIFSEKGNINLNAKIFKVHKKVFLCTISKNTKINSPFLVIWRIKKNRAGIDFKDFFKKLYSYGIQSILFEGGSRLASFLIKNSIPDEIYLFISPSIIGKGLSAFSNYEIRKLSERYLYRVKEITELGNDIMVLLRREDEDKI